MRETEKQGKRRAVVRREQEVKTKTNFLTGRKVIGTKSDSTGQQFKRESPLILSLSVMFIQSTSYFFYSGKLKE